MNEMMLAPIAFALAAIVPGEALAQIREQGESGQARTGSTSYLVERLEPRESQAITFVREGVVQPIRWNMVLQDGDTIRVDAPGAQVTILDQNRGHRFWLKYEDGPTVFTLGVDRQCRLHIGNMQIDVFPALQRFVCLLGEGEREAQLGVDGTIFDLHVGAELSEVRVKSGKVTVTGSRAGESCQVEEEHKLEIRSDGWKCGIPIAAVEILTTKNILLAGAGVVVGVIGAVVAIELLDSNDPLPPQACGAAGGCLRITFPGQ